MWSWDGSTIWIPEWREKAPYSALRILEKLREMGFDGGYIRTHFGSLKGYPEEILYDNMKQVVIKRLLKQQEEPAVRI